MYNIARKRGLRVHGAAAGFDLGDAEAAEITNAELSEHGYRGGCEYVAKMHL